MQEAEEKTQKNRDKRAKKKLRRDQDKQAKQLEKNGEAKGAVGNMSPPPAGSGRGPSLLYDTGTTFDARTLPRSASYCHHDHLRGSPDSGAGLRMPKSQSG